MEKRCFLYCIYMCILVALIDRLWPNLPQGAHCDTVYFIKTDRAISTWILLYNERKESCVYYSVTPHNGRPAYPGIWDMALDNIILPSTFCAHVAACLADSKVCLVMIVQSYSPPSVPMSCLASNKVCLLIKSLGKYVREIKWLNKHWGSNKFSLPFILFEILMN